MQSSGVDLLLKALDVSLDRHKLLVAILEIVTITTVGLFFLFVAGKLAGNGDSQLPSLILLFMGAALTWVVASWFNGALSHLSYEELAGRPRPSIGEAFGFATHHLASLLLVPILLLAILLGASIVEALVLLVGRIPSIGGFLAVLLFLPIVLVNAALIFALFFGTWLTPAIVAGDQTGPMQTMRQLESLVRQTPGRLIAFFTLTLVLMFMLGGVLYGILSAAGTQTQLLIAMAGGVNGTDLGLSSRLLGLLMSLAGYGGLSALGLGSPDVGLIGLLYLLAWVLLFACAAAVPFAIFPLSSACAVHINLAGAAALPQPAIPAGYPAGLPPIAPVAPYNPSAPAYLPPGSGTPPAVSPSFGSTLPAAPPASALPPTQAMTRCRSCGAELRPNARFCGKCGTTTT